MKQKYTILKDDNTGSLTIQEYAELSKDMFSLICEESYSSDSIASAMGENKKALIDTLRTPNLYPISDYIDKIADSVIGLYDESQKEAAPVELIFDDVDLFKPEETAEEESEDESVEIEDLLEDDSEDSEEDDKDDKDESKSE